jgi:hypothetical protein
MRKFIVPCTNATGARCVVVVELTEEEACICSLSPRTAENIARTFVARHAVQRLPEGFNAFDLVPEEIGSVH